MFKVKPILGGLLLGALVLILLTIPLWLSLAITINLLVPSGAWRPLSLVTAKPSHGDTTINSNSGRELIVRIYAGHSADRGGLVIYTPFIGGGLDDERLVNLAETFARAGFVVAIPWHGEATLTVNQKDSEDVVATILHLQQETGSSRVGIFGISYGSGPAAAAVIDDRVAQDISFLVSLNGFANLDSLVAFVRTGHSEYQGTTINRKPHSYTQELLDNTLAANQETDIEQFLTSSRYRQLHQSLSPAFLLASDIEQTSLPPVFLIHSTDDAYIPYTETLQLHDRLSTNGRASLLALTDVVQHGTYRQITFTTLRTQYLPTTLDFTRLVRTLLSVS